ncbi:MAG: Dihydropteroate synthase [Gammaproteobacteria bacterium]|jgi:dihydropteroate synthase|nr:Dihydropteroate synthase [Gammaproteobacteria bacterium]
MPPTLRCGDKTLDLSRPIVMGVVNVTPDSFSDGGRFLPVEAAVAHGLRLVEEGAAIIDIGGESTRPGAAPVSVDEELRRVLPVVERLRQATEAVISVDTSKPEVIREAAAAGAGLINDVRALTEPGALEAAAASGSAICVMHMQGDPRTMQRAPSYVDVVKEVKAFLDERVQRCRAAGVSSDRIVVDPGFGFGKNLEHNLELLRRLRDLQGEWPLLVGLSRKSMVGTLTGRSAGERVHGSVALAVIASINGARIVRAHDVAATVDALKMVAAVYPGAPR